MRTRVLAQILCSARQAVERVDERCARVAFEPAGRKLPVALEPGVGIAPTCARPPSRAMAGLGAGRRRGRLPHIDPREL